MTAEQKNPGVRTAEQTEAAKRRAVLVFSVLGLLAVGTVLLLAYLRGKPVIEISAEEFYFERYPELKVAETGPWPKFELSPTSIDFGQVFEGEQLSRQLTLSNRGEAPLLVRLGSTRCDCALTGLPEDPIPPGGSVELTVAWRPQPSSEMFVKSIDLLSNDPQARESSISIEGKSLPLFVQYPKGEWPVELIRDDQPTEYIGLILSPAKEDFEIVSIDTGDAPLTVETRPTSPETNIRLAQGRPGMELVLKVRPEMPVGDFRYPVKVLTNIPGPRRLNTGEPGDPETLITLQVVGRRRGPFKLAGPGWFSDRNLMTLGTFESQEGAKRKFLLLCEDAGVTDLEVLSIESGSAGVKFSAKKDAGFKGKGTKWDLLVEFPAGGPAETHQDPQTIPVRVRTNHPRAPDLEFQLDFTAI
jgi:hypothetical protein